MSEFRSEFNSLHRVKRGFYVKITASNCGEKSKSKNLSAAAIVDCVLCSDLPKDYPQSVLCNFNPVNIPESPT